MRAALCCPSATGWAPSSDRVSCGFQPLLFKAQKLGSVLIVGSGVLAFLLYNFFISYSNLTFHKFRLEYFFFACQFNTPRGVRYIKTGNLFKSSDVCGFPF